MAKILRGEIRWADLNPKIGREQSGDTETHWLDSAIQFNQPIKEERSMLRFIVGAVAVVVGLAGCAPSDTGEPPQDAAALEEALEDIRAGWEEGDGRPFYTHFLDWEGARYFEGGGENVGLQDLVENHVEPEAELGLRLGFSNIQTHFEGDFAWAVVDTDIQLRTADGRDIHNRGHGTYLFRWMDEAWKIVHTQSSSSPVRMVDGAN